MLTKGQLARIVADMKPLCVILKEWRELMELTPAEAARRCKMPAQHYWQIEHNERVNLRPATLQKLAEATGFPIERLAVAAAYSVITPLAEPVPA